MRYAPIIVAAVLLVLGFVWGVTVWREDFGNAAEWVTALATLGLFAVAWSQLDRFNNNERIKNTLQYLRLAREPFSIEGNIQDLTPLDAIDRVAAQAPGSPQGNVYNTNPIVPRLIVSNYFSEAASLRERNLIDRSLFAGLLFDQILRLAGALHAIQADPEWRGLRTTDPGFRELIADAEREKRRAGS